MINLISVVTIAISFSFSFVTAQASQDESLPGLKAFDTNITVTVLNIQKSENSGWKDETFKDLVEGSDLILIQESVDAFPTYRSADEFYIDSFYKSWGDFRYNTGLTSLSKVPFDEAKRLVSVDTEPVAATPKVTSIEQFIVKGLKQKLLVANTHAINFTGLSAYKRQISAVAEELKKHDGPVVWAGDFNTWSGRRKEYLDSVMSELGLVEISFNSRTELLLVLDHAYVKGVVVKDAKQLQLGISDHEPLRFTLSFQD